VAATHLQDFLSAKVQLRRYVMIKLDAAAVGFVVRFQSEAHRWLRFEGIVQEQHLSVPQPPSEKGIPQPPDGLAGGADGKQSFE
jgi:hypothetical protein